MLWLLMLILVSLMLLVRWTILKNRTHWWPFFMALFDIEEVSDDGTTADTEISAVPPLEDRSWETRWWWRHRRVWSLAWRWGPWILTGVVAAHFVWHHGV